MTALREYSARVTQPELSATLGPARYDELVTPEGMLRPAWKSLAEVAVGLSEADLRRVGDEIERMLADDGVGYAPRESLRPEPWQLDPLPLVIDAEEWSALEIGLAQRAELLNALLADLYGEQRVLSSGVLPPAAVFAHPGFVRPVARPSAYDARPLIIVATDLGRAPDGTWTVLGDRAQAPSGIGYAMENRRVISRVLPELYAEARLHRMGPFFGALRHSLIASALGDDAQARVVVLSPGSGSETAYDQAFVASSLGFPLVEGTDLVVRDGRVWLRAPGRLERVDVVLRRVDAAYCDPLELRGDSRLGVAGLTEAVRRGSVRVVNGLGAGVLDNPALLPYADRLARLLLDEDLRLPAVPTLWGGDPAQLDELVDRVDDLLVRTLDRPGPLALPREALRQRILAEPSRYVGQEPAPLSVAPVLGSAGVGSAPITLRTFTLRHGGGYRPMVGGLARVLDGAGGVRSSKDVWVLKARPEDADQGITESFAAPTVRTVEATLPRVLEDMYWIGRYTERADAMLRLVVTSHAMAEDFRLGPNSAGGRSLAVLMAAITRLAGAPYGPDELDADFRSVLLDGRRAGSVAQSVAALRDAAQSVRDQLSADVWRGLGVHDRAATLLVETQYSHQIAESAGRMLTAMLAIDGVTHNMMRDPGWHSIRLGKALERSLQLVHLLRGTTTERRGIDVDHRVLDAVLATTESAVTHRRRYRGHVRPGNVLDLLLLDTDNPRSLRFTLDRAAEHLGALPSSTGSSRPERLLADLQESLAGVEIGALIAIGGVDRPNLARFLDDHAERLGRLCDAAADLHFSAGPAPRPFGPFSRGWA